MRLFKTGILPGLLLSAVFLLCASALAQTPNCGLVNDTKVHIPLHYAAASDPHFDGSQLAPPANINGMITDPTFGCVIKRLTNSPVAPGNGNFCNHEYSNMSPVNANDTLVLLSCNAWFIADISGNVIVSPGRLPWNGGEGARWDPVNPNTFYYLISPNTGHILYKGAVPAPASCAPNCTIAQTVLHTFAEYGSMDFCGGEGDLFSPDHILLCGMRVSDGGTDAFVYTISTDTKGPALNITTGITANGGHFDNVQLTGSNQMVVNWGNATQSPIGSCGSGPCYTGFEAFGAPCNGVGCSPANAAFVRHLMDFSSHSVESRDNSGNDILVTFDTHPLYCGNSGVLTIAISTGTVTCIVNLLPWDYTANIGATKNLSGNNWILVTNEDSSSFGGSSSSSYPLNANWNLPSNSSNLPTAAGQWGLYSNEGFMINPTGTRVYRMFNPRSRPGEAKGNDYWKLPFGSLSRDGAYIIFDSDFGQGENFDGVTTYADVYEVATGVVATPAGAVQAPTSLTIVGIN